MVRGMPPVSCQQKSARDDSMSPITHLLASWVVAAKTTDNVRDRRLVTLAGILPDADGLGVFVDMITRSGGHPGTQLYWQYHHYLLHGLAAGLLISTGLCLFARKRLRVLFLGLCVFHLHRWTAIYSLPSTFICVHLRFIFLFKMRESLCPDYG